MWPSRQFGSATAMSAHCGDSTRARAMATWNSSSNSNTMTAFRCSSSYAPLRARLLTACGSDQGHRAVFTERDLPVPRPEGRPLECLFVQFYSPSGAVGYGQITIFRLQRLPDQVPAAGAVVRYVFEDQEVRRAGGQVHVDDGRERPHRVVRRERAVECLRHGRDLLALQDSAGTADIRLDDVDGVAHQQFPELELGVEHLAGRDRDLH